MPPDKPDERLIIETLSSLLQAVMDSNATPGLKTIAAIMVAARCARRTAMPAFVAAAMLSTYTVRGDPF